MMFLSSLAELQSALDKIQPRRVAVAYLGAGWRDYLSLHSLDEILVSPTLGSNPWALAGLLAEAERCGRPRVYFLEALHAKLYHCTGELDYNEAASDGEAHAMTFLEGDDIRVGDWLLCWEARADGRLWKGKADDWRARAGWPTAQRFLAELKAAYLISHLVSAGDH